jgi:molecular chaperone DnaK (HSP70)
VTVVSVGDGDNPEIRVVCARGDHELGGKDWDKIISDHYVAEFESATEKSISPDEEPEEYHEVIYDLKLRAETDKQLLTAKDKVTANIKFGSERHKVELSRAQFDDLTKEKLAATFTLTDELLARNKELGEKSPDVWLLVGGSTRMRQVHEKLAERYSLTEGENLIEWEPSEAVAKGAALIAKILIDNPAQAPDSNGDTPALPGHTKPQHKGPSFVCIATHTYGVECLKNGSNTDTWVSNLIERDTPIPQGGVLSKKKRFGVAADGTTQLSLRVFENGDTVEFTEISQSKALKDAVNGEEILFDLPQALNTGSPIDIRLDLDEQGILSLFAEDPVSGASKEARFEVGLSQKDVDEAKKKIGGLVSAE